MRGLGLGLGLTKRRGAGAPAPTPSILDEGDARVYEDTGGTDPAEDTDVVASWVSGQGSFAFVQSSAGSRPVYATATKSLTFDGTNDHLVYAGALADTVGTVVVAFKTGATAFATRGDQVLLSQADDDAANNWFEVGIDATGRIYVERNAAGSKRRAVGSTFLERSTGYVLAVAHDGTDWYAEVNGVEQNPLAPETFATGFGWFGDVTSPDNVVVGGTVTSGGLVRPFQGSIYEVRVYAEDIT